jgi:NAD(P)-dependent dehydrogenase (short-subunit alcohol dehydrogenase family)
VALVTGAGSGLGEASALMLAREGARVVLADLNEAAAKRVLGQLKAEGGEGMAVPMDVSQEADWERVIARVQRRYQALHVAVNCAGINRGHKDPRETTLADWQAVMAVNLDGVFLGTKHCLRLMTASSPVNGSIINISSIMGKIATPGAAAYCASKGAVLMLTKAAALEWAPLGIRVNSVHPGYVETPLVHNILREVENGNEVRETLVQQHALGRLAEPIEIANAIVFLASDESSFMTGSEMVVDGGYTAR